MKNAELQKCMVGMMLALAMSAHAQDFPPEQIKLGGDTLQNAVVPTIGAGQANGLIAPGVRTAIDELVFAISCALEGEEFVNGHGPDWQTF